MSVAPKVKLTQIEKEDAYKLITKACSRQILDKEGRVDLVETKKILMKYFGGSEPLLDINEAIPEQEGFTPLFFASYFNFLEGTKILHKLGASLALEVGKEKIIPLDLACANRRLPLAQFFLLYGDKGAVNHQSASLVTPLMRNCEAGNIEITNLLLKQKPNVLLKDINNLTCIDYANNSGNSNIAKLIQYTYFQASVENTNSNARRSKSKI